MSESHRVLNALPHDAAEQALARCCGARRWIRGMLMQRPFASEAQLMEVADATWATMARDDLLEAFSKHPKIGEDLSALRAKFASTSSWSQAEQARVAEADEATLLALRDLNRAYLARFGFIFIVCATGKSAGEMLSILRTRLSNEPDVELAIAAGEQAKITKLRLEKLSACLA